MVALGELGGDEDRRTLRGGLAGEQLAQPVAAHDLRGLPGLVVRDHRAARLARGLTFAVLPGLTLLVGLPDRRRRLLAAGAVVAFDVAVGGGVGAHPQRVGGPALVEVEAHRDRRGMARAVAVSVLGELGTRRVVPGRP